MKSREFTEAIKNAGRKSGIWMAVQMIIYAKFCIENQVMLSFPEG